MASLNKVMLIGNLTRDPEIRYTPKGTALAEVGLAVNRRYTAENGEKREEVTFIDVTMWGKTAELAEQYLKKGRSVYIEGRLRLDTWDDKQTGQKRSKLGVVCEEMQFLGSREGGGEPRTGGEPRGGGESRGSGDYEDNRPTTRPPQRPTNQRPSGPPKPPVDPDLDVEGDDIPF